MFFPTEDLRHKQEGFPARLLPATLVERSCIARRREALFMATCRYFILIGLNFFLKDYSWLVDPVEPAVFFMALSLTVLKIIPRALAPPWSEHSFSAQIACFPLELPSSVNQYNAHHKHRKC